MCPTRIEGINIMKELLRKRKATLVSIFACLSMMMFMNCQPNKETGSQTLVTERQESLLKNYTHITGEVFPQVVGIDVPTKGPEALVDSIIVFLNERLYVFFDNGEECHLSYEDIFSTDLSQLVEHYHDAYAPFFLSDSTVDHEFLTDCMEINLVAQTSAYITYEVNNIFFGEGVETAKEWVTFVKSDGHRLKDVISDAEMLRFYREHPELRNNGVWEDIHDEENPCGLACEVGLLDDSLAHQYSYAPGILEDITYPLEAIAPYLSQEAQDLIK